MARIKDEEIKNKDGITKKKGTEAKHASPEQKSGIAVKLLKVFGCILVINVLITAGTITYLSLTEYKPADTEAMLVEGYTDNPLDLNKDEIFTVMSWNIGYGALGDNADFFMDGGKSVNTADPDRLSRNLDNILSEIRSADSDFVLIQETDRDSSRSHQIDEYELIAAGIPRHSSSFANNFKVSFLPIPMPPIGKVDSGIATYSKYDVDSAERIQLPVPFKWPSRPFNLKRCLLLSRIPVKGSVKELVLVNLHLEAFDNGEGKVEQTKMLFSLLNAEVQKGNYVIAGGDFNQRFSSVDPQIYPLQEGTWHPGYINVDEINGDWQYLMDETVPSCRSLDKPYAGADHDSFQYYLIDGFIVSANIKVKSVKTHDLDFESTDHNPVLLEASLKEK